MDMYVDMDTDMDTYPDMLVAVQYIYTGLRPTESQGGVTAGGYKTKQTEKNSCQYGNFHY